MPPSLAEVPEIVWEKRGQENALKAFRRAARTVPAYRAFLKEHGVRPKDIHTFEDFQQLPTTSKQNYLQRYDQVELMPGGKLDGTVVFTSSSGFSGRPFFWPRMKHQDDGAIRGLRAIYSLFDVDRKPTLVLIALSLGVHTAGQMMTEWSLKLARAAACKMTVVTPGSLSEADVLEVVKHLSPRFEQTLIWGYPSICAETVKAGIDQGISWGDLNTFILTGGESVSEGWRRQMLELLGGSPHPMRVATVYGSAEVGIMGFDTPTSILVRQLAHDRESLGNCLFQGKVPGAFVQFNPMSRFFETVEGELAMTAWQAVPLIRYVLRDAGDVTPFSSLIGQLDSCNIDVKAEFKAQGIRPEHIWRMPFLSCFGRTDGAVIVVNANVYPLALQPVFAAHHEVSHFKLAVEENASHEKRFLVYAEWRNGLLSQEKKARLQRMLHDEVVQALVQTNTEYRESLKEDAAAADPKIVIVEAGTGPFASDAGRWKRSYICK